MKDPAPRNADKYERLQWSGKVRIFERRNRWGVAEYSAQYRLRWFLEWVWVESGPGQVLKGRGGRRLDIAFSTFETAKIAAQLKWNAESDAYKRAQTHVFTAWRKIWP